MSITWYLFVSNIIDCSRSVIGKRENLDDGIEENRNCAAMEKIVYSGLRGYFFNHVIHKFTVIMMKTKSGL